jgi:hypothetical protein
MRGILKTGGAIATAMLIGASAQAMTCAAGDRDGLAVRALQTRLMVAALTCDARADYNQFVTRFRPQLTEHGSRLRRYFRHAHGNRHKQALNSYVTDLANRASTLSINDRAGFCTISRTAFARLLGSSDRQAYRVLSQVAAETAARDPRADC